MDILSTVALLFAGVAAGVVFEPPIRRALALVRRTLARVTVALRLPLPHVRARQERDWQGRDYADLGIFTIWRWSPERPLERTPNTHRLEYVDRRTPQTWFDESAVEAARNRQRLLRKGRVAYAHGMKVDHREHDDAHAFILQVSEAAYADMNAIGDCLMKADMVSFVRDLYESGSALAFLGSFPPTRLSIQVAVLSPARNLLAVRRSAAVESSTGLWTFGPNETLVPEPEPATPGIEEPSLFTLAERCLREECGIGVDEIGPIYVTWFGATANPGEGVAQNVLAITTSKLSERDIVARIVNAHSNYEVSSIEWIPFTFKALRRALARKSADRQWIVFSHVAAQEAWRYRRLLIDDLEAARSRRSP